MSDGHESGRVLSEDESERITQMAADVERNAAVRRMRRDQREIRKDMERRPLWWWHGCVVRPLPESPRMNVRKPGDPRVPFCMDGSI